MKRESVRFYAAALAALLATVVLAALLFLHPVLRANSGSLYGLVTAKIDNDTRRKLGFYALLLIVPAVALLLNLPRLWPRDTLPKSKAEKSALAYVLIHIALRAALSNFSSDAAAMIVRPWWYKARPDWDWATLSVSEEYQQAVMAARWNLKDWALPAVIFFLTGIVTILIVVILYLRRSKVPPQSGTEEPS